MMSEMFSGPIAHPRHLREYEEILPGSANRIITMAENAQDHNRSMETRLVTGSVWEAKAGMVLGFIALIVLISCAMYAGLHGNNILAGIMMTGAVLSGAATLIRGYVAGSKPDK
jgi:uncharacterized membrane protein